MSKGKAAQPTGRIGFMEFRLQNVNGIEDATIRLEQGKITELRGRNGAGKSSAMAALMRYLGDDKAPVEVFDGADVGSIEGPGPTMMVTDKIRMRGAPSIQMADKAGALVRLITGKGRKGATERSREYIKALAELVDVPVDDESLKTICYGDEDLITWLRRQVQFGGITDLFTAAGLLKPEIDDRALRREQDAGVLEGKIEAAVENIRTANTRLQELGVDPVPDDTPCNPVAAQNATAAAGVRHAELKGKLDAKLEKLALQERVRGSLGPRPTSTAEEAAFKGAEQLVVDQAAEVRRLEELLAAARDALTQRQADARVAKARWEDASARIGEWAAQQAILEEKIEGPDEDAVLMAEMDVEQAKVEEERHRITADLRLARAAKTKAEGDQSGVVTDAKRLRSMAKGLADRLGEELGKRGLENITVEDGRLHWRDPESGNLLDWDTRMSSGQRIRAAFALAAAQFQGVVFLPSNEENAFYLLLDEDNREELERITAEMDLFVVTEVPRGNDFTVVSVPQSAGAS